MLSERQLEILEEFAAAARLRGDRGLERELYGFFDEHEARVVYVIHRQQDEASRREAARRASAWYALHGAEVRGKRQRRRVEYAAQHQGPCAQCGGPVQPPKRGPLTRTYCSKRCNYRAWVLRTRAAR